MLRAMAALRERNLIEAWLHGWAVILGVIAVTIALVLGLTLLCDCELDGQHFVVPIAAGVAAGSFAYLARLTRTLR